MNSQATGSNKTRCLLGNYPESRFGGFSDVDGTVRFFQRVNALVQPDSVVVDVGCGRGKCLDDPVRFRRELQVFKGKAAKVIGIDVDPAAAENPFIDEYHQIDGSAWPLKSATADVVVSDWVLEHVEDPNAFFSELSRITKPGGQVCLRTPNAWGYVAMVSRLIPNKHHARVLGKTQGAGERSVLRQDEDVFPTHYLCNTRRRLLRQLERNGFRACVYGVEAEPSYLVFSPFLYRLGAWYHRVCPSALRNALFAFAEKT